MTKTKMSTKNNPLQLMLQRIHYQSRPCALIILIDEENRDVGDEKVLRAELFALGQQFTQSNFANHIAALIGGVLLADALKLQ